MITKNPRAASKLERIELEIEILVIGGDARVANQHGRVPNEYFPSPGL